MQIGAAGGVLSEGDTKDYDFSRAWEMVPGRRVAPAFGTRAGEVADRYEQEARAPKPQKRAKRRRGR